MKRRIIATNQHINLGGVNIDDVFGQLQSQAANVGYTFEIDDNLNITLDLDDKADYMPSIEVETVIDDNSVVFYPKMSFPELDTSRVSGDTLYYLQKWTKVAKFVRDLHLFVFNPEEWEGYDEVGELDR